VTASKAKFASLKSVAIAIGYDSTRQAFLRGAWEEPQDMIGDAQRHKG